jgi:NADPH-dependent curcumin reductase CurA
MSRENKRVVLAERPKTHIVPGQTFKLVKEPAPTADQLKDGEILVETLYLSLDPAMRGWLNGMWLSCFFFRTESAHRRSIDIYNLW